MAWALGFWAGQRGTPAQATPNPKDTLQTLQGRLLHARNMGMRLQELATTEQRLHEEQAHLALLHELKDEVNWLLSEVQSRLDRHLQEDPAQLEAMIDATGKSLRLLMDAGRQPHATWSKASEGLNHLHKTLCLIRDLSAPNPVEKKSQYSDFHINYTFLSQSLIKLHRTDRIHHDAPFSSLDAGVELRLREGATLLVLWSHEEAEA